MHTILEKCKTHDVGKNYRIKYWRDATNIKQQAQDGSVASQTVEMEDYREIYESHRPALVVNLRIHRTFLFDYLRSKKVLDKDDCELIQAEKTSERKAAKLLDLLGHKGQDGFVCFTEALHLQSPELYTMLTGKDAGSTPNPILTRYNNSRLGREGGMEDMEMELLTEHLSSAYEELQRIRSQYTSILLEKRKLEGKLMTNEVDLERHKCKLTAWEEKFYSEKTNSMKKQTQCQKLVHTLAFENEQARGTIKSLETDIIRMEIQQLQGNQEVEELQTLLNNANTKKYQEIRYRQEMGESYEKERKQAARLSLKIKYQEDELQVLDGYKRRCGDLELFNKELKDENERLRKESSELEKWTKGLKNRFDLIESENVHTREDNLNVSQNILALQNELKVLKDNSSYLEVENDFLKFRVSFLERDCEIYKQQRDAAMISRNEAAEERDKVWREREAAWEHYLEIQKSRDLEIEKRETCMKEFDDMKGRCTETASELAKTKLKLNEAKLMVEEMNLKMTDMTEKEENKREIKEKVRNEANLKESSDKDVMSSCTIRMLIQSVKRRLYGSTNEKSHTLASSGNTKSLSDRTPSFNLLMSFLTDSSEDINDKDKHSSDRMKRFASCPNLDETDTSTIARDQCSLSRQSLSISMPDLSLLLNTQDRTVKKISERKNSHGTDEDSSSSSSDSDNQEGFINYPLSSNDKENLSKEPFRRRTNVMVTKYRK